jgi:hypothetical protein
MSQKVSRRGQWQVSAPLPDTGSVVVRPMRLTGHTFGCPTLSEILINGGLGLATLLERRVLSAPGRHSNCRLRGAALVMLDEKISSALSVTLRP